MGKPREVCISLYKAARRSDLASATQLAMTSSMKPACLILAAALCLPSARADALSDAEREALLQKLEEMRSDADSKVDARYRAAIAAYQAAMSSDQAAIDLYLNCVEKVNFKDRQRKNSDFRNWKRSEAEKLSDPGMGLALRLQLRWLILTLRAASEKTERDQLLSGVREVVDAIVNDTEKLKNQRQILDQSAASSLFARAYEIGEVKVDNWVFSPGQIGDIYEKILLPPLRSARNTDSLRSAWLRRISQETRIRELLSGQGPENGEKRRIGMANNMRGPELDQFMSEAVPELQWSMEIDLYRHGDQRNAAVRMLGHLEKNLGHPSARKWTAEFIGLLSGKDESAAPAGAVGESPS